MPSSTPDAALQSQLGVITHTTGGDQESQLEQDLALFLANPSLRAALEDGSLDLASYSDKVQTELAEEERACIEVYRAKAEEIRALQDDWKACQTTLAALHEMLLGFQADLGGLSGDIRALQEKSRQLDVQLRNRQSSAERLHAFLAHVVLAPPLAQTLTTGTVNPVFCQAVEQVNQLYHDCLMESPQAWAEEQVPASTAAGGEMAADLSKLRLVAVGRIREYFLQQMTLLRRPQTNIRMIQVHGLLNYASLQDFLAEASPVIADEIFAVYVESMSKTLQQLFRTYQTQLLQLDLTRSSATRSDVIAIDDALLRDSLTTRAKKRVDVFCLGRRATDCLQLESSSPILAHVAGAENHRYPYEQLFRSLLGHLVDAVTNEHVFGRLFFKRDAFEPLFHATLSLLLEQLENYLFGCYDALCLLLMIKVTHSYRRLARSRKIHSLDGFFETVTKLLWPRLKTVMDGHLRSLKSATAVKLGGVELHAHYVTRRLAEFCCSILLILHNPVPGHARKPSALGFVTPDKKRPSIPTGGPSSAPPASTNAKTITATPLVSSSSSHHEELGKSAGDKLLEDLSALIDEYVNLLDRLADEHTSNKKKIVFMINNLDHVVCIFQERRVLGKEFNRFVELLMKQRELFVEEELLTGFSQMIAFVHQTEAHLAATPKGESYDVNPQVVEALVMDFASNWKSNMDQINRDVLSYFSNFRNGMEILKQVLTQLLLYYTRFHDIIRKVWRNKPPAFCKDLVSTNLILTEIKKYALAI